MRTFFPRTLNLIGFFREDIPQLLENLQDGLDDGDAAHVKRAVHSIKGLAAGFAADRLVLIASNIERHATDQSLDKIPEHVANLPGAISELESALADFEF